MIIVSNVLKIEKMLPNVLVYKVISLTNLIYVKNANKIVYHVKTTKINVHNVILKEFKIYKIMLLFVPVKMVIISKKLLHNKMEKCNKYNFNV